MNIRPPLITSALLAASLFSGAAHAALEGRDLNGSAGSFEAYYDTDLNITWLANADVNGLMTWDAATTWAANLSFTDGIHTYADWRLPTTLQPDVTCAVQSGGESSGYGCTGSEMGHLFYIEFGGHVDDSRFHSFYGSEYWSETERVSEIGPRAWTFAFYANSGGGYQAHYGEGGVFHALAVSNGDIAAVPEVDTWTMMLAGLGGVVLMARRRRKA